MADVQIAVIDQQNTQLALAAPEETQVNIAVPGIQGAKGDTGSVSAAADGTAALPGIAFANDLNTGIYRPGGDQLALATNGTGRLFVDASGVGIGAGAGGTNFLVKTPGSDIGALFRHTDGTNNPGFLIYTNESNDLCTLDTISSTGSSSLRLATNGNERLRITSTGQLQFNGLGSNTAPILSFTTDTNTGIYSPGADQLAISTNGQGRLFVDASGQVGIGRQPLAARTLSVQGRVGVVNQSGSNDTQLALYSDGTTNGIYSTYNATGSYVPLTFYTSDVERARIRVDGLFEIKGNGTAGSSPAFSVSGSAQPNSLVIDSSGRVGLGSSSPGVNLEIQAAAGNSSNAAIRLRATDPTGGAGSVADITTIGTAAQQSALTFSTRDGSNVVERFRIDASGRVGIGTTTVSALLHLRKDANSTVPGDSASIVLSNRNTTLNGNIAGGIFVDTFRDVSDPAYSAGIWFTRIAGGANLSSKSDIIFGNQGTFGTGLPSESARIDSSGRLLVGTASAFTAGGDAQYGKFQMAGNSFSTAGHAILALGRGEAATAITADEALGYVTFSDVAGNTFASIHSAADANAGSGDYPGRLVFSTNGGSPDTSPTERMRITSGGNVNINTVGANLRLLSGGGASSWGQGIRIGHDDTYYAGIFCNGDTNFDRQYLDFWTSRATSAGLIARLTDRFYCNVTTITAFSSERRYKQNIDLEPLAADKCWEVARDLPVRTYEYKDNPGNMVYGPIVDEIEPIDPSLILDTGRTDDEGHVRTYDNGRLQAMYHVALQTALKRIETLEAKVAALEAQ